LRNNKEVNLGCEKHSFLQQQGGQNVEYGWNYNEHNKGAKMLSMGGAAMSTKGQGTLCLHGHHARVISYVDLGGK